MKFRKRFLLVFAFLLTEVSGAGAQSLLMHEDFNDGDFSHYPPWLFHDEAEQCFSIDSTRYLSSPFSLRVQTSNQRASIQTVTGIINSTTPFSVETHIYVSFMGDEAIPLFLKGKALIVFLFLLPDGRVQLTVLKERTGWVPANLNIYHGYQTGRWHTFRITYDGRREVMLYIDDILKGTIHQSLIDAPVSLLIGNPSLTHTSTFYVDDIRIFGPRPQSPPGNIYLILCSDTGTWNGLNMFKKSNYFRYGLFSDPGANSFRVINRSFRERFRDSNEKPLVLTWFMLVGSIMAHDTNPKVQFPWISNLEMMQRYHDRDLRELGDELALHYHNWVWNDPDGDGIYHWNQSVQFEEYRENFIATLGHLIIDGNLFPTSFRSGWHYMDNQWEQLLDEWIPYRFENSSPAKHTDTTEPLDNIYDWSRAPLDWLPYHPDSLDYQSKGGLRGWETRCQYMKQDFSTILDLFARAREGATQVVTFWSHLPESDFPHQIATLDSLLHLAAWFYPNVQWEYCTATEAMQKWRETSDTVPPEIQYQLFQTPDTVGITISVNEPIWQSAPLLFAESRYGKITKMAVSRSADFHWRCVWKAGNSDIHLLGIGVTDTSGNATVQVVDLSSSRIAEGEKPLLKTYKLFPIYPNPSSRRFTISYYLPRPGSVTIEIFNIRGRRVFSVQAAFQPSGIQTLSVPAHNWPTNIYFVRMKAARFSATRKILVRR